MSSAERSVPAAPTQYVWGFPGSPITVHLHLDVVQRLKEQVQQVSPEGAQQEGLLFGITREGATEILDVEPANSRSIVEMLSTLPKSHADRVLAGYYRIDRTDVLCLNDNDRSLAERFFPKPHQVFLVIQPTPCGIPNATFFFREGPHRMTDFVLLEFPLDASLLTSLELDRIRVSQQELAAPPPAEAEIGALPFSGSSPLPRKHRIRRAVLWSFSSTVVLAAAIAIGARGVRERIVRGWTAVANTPNPTSVVSARPSTVVGPSMGLHAQLQNGNIEFTWDRQSALITAARSGVISIQDGALKRELPLNADQVHGGSLLYSPAGDQVIVQLTVETPVINATETVMVVLPKQRAASQSATVSVTGTSARVKAGGASENFAASVNPPRPLTFRAQPAIAVPPTLPPAGDPPPVTVDLTNLSPVMQWGPAPVVPPVPAAQHNAPTPAERAPIPALSSYQPPIAVSRTLPKAPPILQRRTSTPKVVEVRVSIDKDGKVTRTESVPRSGIPSVLVDASINAARLWQFRPARLGGEPIESQLVLRFVFTP